MKFIGCWLLHEQQHLLFNEEELALRETVFLNTDREMPLLGLGVYKTADNEAETAITAAQCQAQQEARKYISELFHICQSIKGSI